jgi:hypothetical protein
VVEQLPSKNDALNSNPNIAPRKSERKRKKERKPLVQTQKTVNLRPQKIQSY